MNNDGLLKCMQDTHFYCIGVINGYYLCNVSIPYLSGHPFLLLMLTAKEIRTMCQSPIYRDTHFYHEEIAERNPELVTCQSPIYRDTHFYNPARFLRHREIGCVNPLSIGTPISTLFPWKRFFPESKMCQSPIYRDTHFYCGTNVTTQMVVTVSIPYLSGHPFLLV